jgi:hypothetical protein
LRRRRSAPCRDVLEHTRQAIELADGGAGVPGTRIGRQIAGQVFNGQPDCRQWRPQVMTQRCEQRGRKLRLLSGELRRVSVGHELCPFDRDRHNACNGIEGPDIECGRQRCEQPDRSCAVPQGNNQHFVLLADRM